MTFGAARVRQDPLKGAVITDLGVVLAESQEASLSALRIFDRHPGLGLELLTDPLEGVVLPGERQRGRR